MLESKLKEDKGFLGGNQTMFNKFALFPKEPGGRVHTEEDRKKGIWGGGGGSEGPCLE